MIKKEGKKWVLYSKDGFKKLGEHDSEDDAKKQEAAIEISKHRAGAAGEKYRTLMADLGITPETLARKPNKDEHPFTYCMNVVIPAIEEKQGAVDDPEAFCGWWKGEHEYEAAQARPLTLLGTPKQVDALAARQIHLLGATGTIRTATYDNREHMVVPVVALMEGVIHAINAETPEYVPLACLAVAPQGWNGRPVVLGHPVKDGHQISANSPEVLEAQGFGKIFNARLDGKKLMLEAWIDPAKAEAIGAQETLQKLRDHRMCEVSVGAFVVTDQTPGQFGDRSYKAVWRDIVPDHLAFLPKGLGACSNEMGCGAPRAAAAHLVTADGLETLTPAKAAQTAQTAKPKVDTTDHRSLQPGDTPSQAASEEAAELIAYQTLRTLLDQLSESWDASSEIVDDLIADETDNPAMTSADEEAETEVETARMESLQVLCMSMYSTLNAVMNLTTECLRPEPMTDASPRYMSGARHSSSDRQIIQRVHDHAVSLGAECSGMKAAAETPRVDQPTTEPVTVPAEERAMACTCGNGNKNTATGGEKKMTPEQRTETIKSLIGDKHSGFVAADEKMLEAASDERLDAFRVAAQARAKEVEGKGKETPAAAVDTAAAVATLEAKPMTEADFMKAAPESLRSLISRAQAQETTRKASLVADLKTAQAEYSESELAAMSLDGLERLGRAVGLKAETEPTSFAGRALPRAAAAADKKDVFTNPPDPYADGLKALRAKDGYAPLEPAAQ